MRIPAFALGGTPTPYSEISSPSAGQQAATQTLGRAKMVEASAISTLGDMVNTVSKDVRDFTRRIEEQEAITYVQSKRGQDEIGRAKIRTEWEPTVSGPDALKAPEMLQEKLKGFRDSILEDAPSPRARQFAEQDLDVRHALEYAQGERFARTKAKEYFATVQTQSDDQLAKAAFYTRDPAQLQGILDQSSAAWMAQGKNNIWTSPAEADLELGKAHTKIVTSFILGRLGDPKSARQAIAEIRSGVWADKLDRRQVEHLFDLAEGKERQIVADAHRAQAEAREALHEKQSKNMLELFARAQEDPRGFANELTIPDIKRRAYNGDISASDAKSLMSLLSGSVKKSDPVVLEEAKRLAATGGLTEEFIRENGGNNLSWGDILEIKSKFQSQVDNSVEGKTVKLFVEDMFRDKRVEAQRALEGGEDLQLLHESQVAAHDYASKRMKEGASMPLVKAEVRIKYDPVIGDGAKTESSYVDTIPDDPETLKPYFEKLWKVDAKSMRKEAWNREWKALRGTYQKAEKRKQLKDQIKSMGGQ